MDYSVYMHTAPNGKVYVGITSMSLNRRWGYGSNYYHNEYFSRAIKKYGWDNFKHEVLFTGLTREEAEQKEQELISLYHANDSRHGYNLTSGGEKGKRHHPSSIQKMREKKIGKYDGEKNPRYGTHCSELTKQRIREAHKGKFAGKNNPNYGKPMSEEQKKKIGDSRRGNHYPKLSESVKTSALCIELRNARKRPVFQFTKDGTFIKKWTSAPDASEALLGFRRGQSNICSCANGKIESAYGYVWRYDSQIASGGGECP